MSDSLQYFWAFRTPLGYMAIRGADETLEQLTFGHTTKDEALARLAAGSGTCRLQRADWFPALRHKLEDYAEGAPVEFFDISVANTGATAFVRAVIEECRRIPYGATLSYGELADRVGAPRAGRAVGNVMRTNRCPLVIPCHRVVHSDGRIGQFTAPQGRSMKQRLLAMEAATELVHKPLPA